jgi:syntaxin 1B/2/3
VEQLKRDITMIDENVDVIEQLHTQALMSSNDQQWHQLSKQLENIKTDTKQRNNHVKQKLSGRYNYYHG